MTKHFASIRLRSRSVSGLLRLAAAATLAVPVSLGVGGVQAASVHPTGLVTHTHGHHHVKPSAVQTNVVHTQAIVLAPAGAAVVNVCSTAGYSLPGGLGAALNAGNVITFACNAALSGAKVGGKYVIVVPQTDSPAIDIGSATVSIDGSDGGANDVAIDGGSTSTTTGVQILLAINGSTLTLKNLTFQNAFASDDHPKTTGATDDGFGGAVKTFGNFTGTNLTFLNNKSWFNGGALELSPNTTGAVTVQQTVTNSTFTGNEADLENDGSDGGAIDIGFDDEDEPQTVTISQSTFNGNFTFVGGGGSGGAVWISNEFPANVTIDHSLFSGNTADDDGGAVNDNEDNVTITDSLFLNNTATTGVAGAFYDDACGAGSCFSNVLRDSFIGNSAPLGSGGAIENDDTTEVTANSTFSGNSAKTGGGAIFSDEPTTLIADTIAGNTILATGTLGAGAGIEQSSNTLSIQASIVSNNTNLVPTAAVTNCSGAITDNGFNLEFPTPAVTDCGIVNGTNGDITGSDPLLGAPADNGGPNVGATGSVQGLQTMALTFPTSPAIGKVTGTTTTTVPLFTGVNVCTNPLTVNNIDGRSLPREALVRIPNGCDMGAYDTGDNVTLPDTLLGSLVLPGMHGRVGFVGTNITTGTSRPIQYINGQIGGASFIATGRVIPLVLSCPNQCTGTSAIAVPSTPANPIATVTLSGPIDSARGFVPALTAGSSVKVIVTIKTTIDRTTNPLKVLVTRTVTSVEVQVLNAASTIVLDTGVVTPPFAFGSNVLLIPQ